MQLVLQLLIERTTVNDTLPSNGQCHIVGNQLRWGGAPGVGGPPYAEVQSSIGAMPRAIVAERVVLPPVVVRSDQNLFDLDVGPEDAKVQRKRARAITGREF